jgi:thimet oligopeptidase
MLDQIKDDYVYQYESIVEQILETADEDLSWVTLVQPFIDLDNNSNNLVLLEMKDFYTDKTIRDHCNDLSTMLSQWSVEQSMRRDLYMKYKHYETHQYLVEKPFKTKEQQLYFENIMRDYKLRGLDLPNDMFEELKTIKKEIVSLCSDFQHNMGSENHIEYLTKEELDGLPHQYIEERLQDSGLVKVTLKYPDYIPLMEYAKNRDIRKKFMTLFKSRCIKENTPIITKVFKLRSKMATILGYTNYSDYKLVKSMADNTETVTNFLQDLLEKVLPLRESDMNELQKMADYKLEMWDIAYYSRLYTEKTCDFDKEQLKQYFPVDTVVKGAFDIYQKLLGFTFTKVTDMNNTLWHDSVTLYSVHNTSCMSLDIEDGLVGYFYLDLYPREGKYSHAACFPFISKSENTLPVATMACNFGQGHLSFDEVETFFHEFGHVMHHLSSKAKIKDMASFSCEHDFVETPSQMFEEWCYMPETLNIMSKNLPVELITKLNKSRKMLQGYHYARQLMFGIFDMTIHSSSFDSMGLTPVELFSKIQKDIMNLDTIDNTSEPASFGHLMGGYDAGYYGYLWSLVYAKDLFSMFCPNKLLDPMLGLKLRKEVLSQGALRPSLESIKVFLGRDCSNEAFVNSIIPDTGL